MGLYQRLDSDHILVDSSYCVGQESNGTQKHPCARTGAGLRNVVAQHVLLNLAALRKSGVLGRLAVRHRRELAAALTAALRRRLNAARPLPAMMGRGSSQLLASTNGDSPRSARSMASSRFTGVPPSEFPFACYCRVRGDVPLLVQEVL